MQNKIAIISILILAVPLGLYFVPYAYAATSTATYTLIGPNPPFGITIAPGQSGTAVVTCNPGDVATGGGYQTGGETTAFPNILINGPTNSIGSFIISGTASGWGVEETNPSSVLDASLTVYVECMTPVTVAGMGVPEFGQLYIAIALGALVFFLISRNMAGKKSPILPSMNQ